MNNTRNTQLTLRLIMTYKSRDNVKLKLWNKNMRNCENLFDICLYFSVTQHKLLDRRQTDILTEKYILIL